MDRVEFGTALFITWTGDMDDSGGERLARGKAAQKRRSKLNSAQRAKGQEDHVSRSWRATFLAALAETSNVTEAADAAGVNTSRAYNARREEPDFARAWRDALFEGYEHLEFIVLCFLRTGKLPGEEGRKFDVANAVRLLAAHRDAMARERARGDCSDEQEVLDSIDRMLDDMRERSAANAALLAGDGGDPD
jgi:hypothetical protein